MYILRILAGKIEDNGMLYANAFVLDENKAHVIEDDRIDSGQQHAKIKISTDNNNQIAREIAKLNVLPATLLVNTKSSVRKGELSLTIVGFDSPQK